VPCQFIIEKVGRYLEGYLNIKFTAMKTRIEMWTEAQLELEKLYIEQKELSRKADRLHTIFHIVAGIILCISIFSLLQF
jgi:hypothetical protein